MLKKVGVVGLSLGLALSPLAALAQTPAAPVASHTKSVSTKSHRSHHPQRVSMHKERAKGTALARLPRRS